MKTADRIKQNTELAFSQFKAYHLSRTKEEIFEKAGEIRFYTEVYEFLTGGDLDQYFEETEQIKIDAIEVRFLDLLYYEYLDDEYAKVDTWGDIHEFINSFFERS